jgi:hypothetical protein
LNVYAQFIPASDRVAADVMGVLLKGTEMQDGPKSPA